MPSNFSNIPVYSAADLLRYATGRMTAQEMHTLEKAAMEDPFLAEALDGFHTAAEKNTQPVLQQQIDRLTPVTKQEEERRVVPLWRKKVFQYAAAAVFVIGGWLTYALVQQNNNSNEQNISIASAPEPGSTLPAPSPAFADSSVVSYKTADSVTQNQAANSELKQQQQTYANAETGTYESPAFLPPQKQTEQRAAAIVKDSIQPSLADNTNAPIDLAGKNAVKDQPMADVAATAAAPVIKSETSSTKELAKRKADDTDKFKRSNTNTETRYVFKGRVTDAKNNPLPYANVTVTGEEIGTYTDSKGNFNLMYDDSILPVRTRSLGYESQTVQMKPGNREQQIVMPEDEKLKESLALTVQKPQAKQAGYKPLIIETDSLSSAQPVVSLFDYNTYLLNNNRISELPQASRSVELSFEVNKRGEVKNITVEQSSGKDLDAEAIRLLKEGPKWKPNNGGNGRARVKVKL